MANLGVSSVDIYKAYLDSGGNTSELAAEFPTIEFQNGMVGLEVKSLGGDFSQFVSPAHERRHADHDDQRYYGLVDGYAPINELPTIAEMPQTMSGEVAVQPDHVPVLIRAKPTTRPRPRCSPTSLGPSSTSTARRDDRRHSDSVNQYTGHRRCDYTGLAESYGTGDLNPNQPVDVIQDDPGQRRTKAARCWRTSTTSHPGPAWRSPRRRSAT